MKLTRRAFLLSGILSIASQHKAFSIEIPIPEQYHNAVSIRTYGAIGDGINDDTTAFQRALDDLRVLGGTLIVPEGNYLLSASNSALYIDGKVSLIGLNGARLIISNGETKGRNRISIAVGTRATWQGHLEGLHFTQGKEYNSSLLINIFNASDYCIANNNFDGFSKSTIIKGINDNGWASRFFRYDGKYIRNTIKCTSNDRKSPQEGISVSASGSSNQGYLAEKILIANNKIFGCADDPIALHGVRDALVLSNEIHSLDGRILISDSEKFFVRDNTCSHESSFDTYSAALIHCTWESSLGTIARGCNNFSIQNNRLFLSRKERQDVQAIYIQGSTSGIVSENTIYSNKSKTNGYINISPIKHLGINRASGNIEIKNNIIYGGGIIIAGPLKSPCIISANQLDGLNRIKHAIYISAEDDNNILLNSNSTLNHTGSAIYRK